MRDHLRLGRVAGIPVGLNFSVVVIFVLVVELVATQTLPGEAGGYPTAAYWAVALLIGLVFFGALFAHELAHAIVARRNGVKVDHITLWMLGGVSQLAGEPATAGADLRIAAAGPMTSLALGALFAVAAGASALVAGPALLISALSWLAGINVMLGVFNLLPGAPLDGGRILRALIWQRTHDRTRAALAADRAGRGLGTVMIGLGAIDVLAAGDFIGGLWIAVLGWFLRSAANAEAQATQRHVLLDGVTIGSVMTGEPTSLPDYQTVQRALARVLTDQHSAYPVVSFEGRPVGLVTTEALARVPTGLRETRKVGDVSLRLRQVPTARPVEALADVLDRAVGPLPVLVIEDGRLVGLLTASDVSRVLQRAALSGP